MIIKGYRGKNGGFVGKIGFLGPKQSEEYAMGLVTGIDR